MLRLARPRCRNIVAVKDAAGDLAGSARLLCQHPDGFEVYCGDDALTLPLLAVGAVGLVSVASHWAGPELGADDRRLRQGDVAAARHVNARLVESFDFESTEEFPNPLPAKAACRASAWRSGSAGHPMGAAPPELDGEAHRVLMRLGAFDAPRVGGPGA